MRDVKARGVARLAATISQWLLATNVLSTIFTGNQKEYTKGNKSFQESYLPVVSQTWIFHIQ